MQIRVGYDLVYQCPQPTPMILTLNVHYSRVADLVQPDKLMVYPEVPVSAYRDGLGNWCSRIIAPQGRVRLTSDAVINDRGQPDPFAPWARQRPLQQLPEESLVFLLGSRYCETDLLADEAWRLFGQGPTGWERV
jgi:transglutaminase-like putative cysteine protease